MSTSCAIALGGDGLAASGLIAATVIDLEAMLEQFRRVAEKLGLA
jgi:hypothetical protein